MPLERPTRLFCIPHAGGNAFFYRPLAEICPDSIEVIALELPGRGRRSREPLRRSVTELVDDLFAQLEPLLADGPYAILGHSMGGLLAYLCTVRLRAEGCILPKTLFISAVDAPKNVRECTCPRHMLSREKFFEMVRALGGCPDEVFHEPQLLDYFEPILRADFQAMDTWRPHACLPLPVSIVVFRGEDDLVDTAAATAWKQETSATFRLDAFKGGHFFIQHHWPHISAIIERALHSDQ